MRADSQRVAQLEHKTSGFWGKATESPLRSATLIHIETGGAACWIVTMMITDQQVAIYDLT